eukprot:COSAG04_NODE_1051_length_8554_cov_151.236310_8_plen_90_part_00
MYIVSEDDESHTDHKQFCEGFKEGNPDYHKYQLQMLGDTLSDKSMEYFLQTARHAAMCRPADEGGPFTGYLCQCVTLMPFAPAVVGHHR